jgi:hypothetical protein
MALEQDSNGFLVGTVITDIKRSRKNSDQLLIEVKKIADLLKQQGHLQAGNSDNASTNASANAGNQQLTRRQNQRNNSGSSSNASQSESSNSASSELSENSEQPAQQRRESLRQKRERQRREHQQQRLSQQEQQADSQQQQNPPQPDNNSDSEQSPDNARQRDSRGRFTSEADNDSPEPIIAGGDDATRGRDSRGRFAGGGGGAGGGRTDLKKDGDDGSGGGLGGLIGGLGDRITSAITAGQELQEVDPTIKAFQEVAEPLQRGYQFIFAGSSKKDKPYFAWFNKIWKSLKKTEDNTAEQGGESGFSIMGLITTFLTAGIAAWALFSSSGQAFWGALKQNFIDPVVDSIGNWLKESSGYNKAVDWTSENVVKPVMGAIDDPMGTAAKLFTEGWKLQFEAMRSTWNTVIGGFANFLAPYIVDTWKSFTEWLAGSIMPMLTNGWNQIVAVGASAFDWLIKKFDPVINIAQAVFGFINDKFNAVGNFIADVFTAFSNFMKDKFGIDIPLIVDVVSNRAKEIAQPALDEAEKAKQAVTDFAEKSKKSVDEASASVKEFTAKMWDNTKAIGGAVVDAVGSAASAVGNAIIPSAGASDTPYDGNIGGAGQAKGKGAKFAKGTEANQQMIVEESIKAGVDPKMMLALAAIESGGKSNAHNKSGASGLFQFMPSNFKSYGLEDGKVYDPVLNTRAAIKMVKSNAKHLEKNGIEANTGNIYLAHQQGAGGAVNLLKGGTVGKQAAAQNGGVNGKALADLWTGKANATYMEMGGKVKDVANSKQPVLAKNEQTNATAPQKTVLATPEQVQNAMPKAVQPVSAMPSIASISPIPATTTQTAKMPEMPGLVLPLSNNVKSSPTTIIPDVGQTVSDQHIALIAFPYATSMGNNKG